VNICCISLSLLFLSIYSSAVFALRSFISFKSAVDCC
jgi:hypothetical protein